MKYLTTEIFGSVEGASKDRTDIEKLFDCTSDGLKSFRENHAVIAGAAEGAIGVAAISLGISLLSVSGGGNEIPELVGAALGAVAGGKLSAIGGVGVVMMGAAFSIPAAAVITIGTLSGAAVGALGVNLASEAPSLLEMLLDNISAAALITFGCYMLYLSFKDLWRAGGEFISYLKGLGVLEIPVEK